MVIGEIGAGGAHAVLMMASIGANAPAGKRASTRWVFHRHKIERTVLKKMKAPAKRANFFRVPLLRVLAYGRPGRGRLGGKPILSKHPVQEVKKPQGFIQLRWVLEKETPESPPHTGP
jgi:hypothetical protein